MPWWGWVLIWVGLVLALLTMLAFFGWMLFRKFIATLEAFTDLASTTIIFDGVQREESGERPLPAVLLGRRVVADRYAYTRERRLQRKADRSTRRLERGTTLVRADPRPIARYLAGLDLTRSRVGAPTE